MVGEGADAALAEDDVVIPARHDVLGGHEPFLERRRHAALEQHGLLRFRHALEQTEVLHVARADLNDVGGFFHRLGVVCVHQLGDDADAGALARLL